MKKSASILISLITLCLTSVINIQFVNAQNTVSSKLTNNYQLISNQILLAKLKSEQAESGLVVLVDLSINKVISKSSFIKKGNEYISDSSLLTQPIEPGSMIMPMSAAIIIDNFGVTLNDTCDLEKGKTFFNGRVIVDAEQHGMHFTNLKTILAESSNVGIAKLVTNNFQSHNNKINFDDNIRNYVGSNKYILKETRDNSLLPFKAIGYGVLLTPIEIFNFYKRVANSDSTLFNNASTLSQIQNALIEVCNNGTAKRLFSDSKYSFAGKTSTSLVAGKKGYGKAQFQAAIIGYSSIIKPRYACMVIIKCHPHAANHFGASVAGPVFKTIMENALKKL
jgi:cell division protein FtsI (penicillin-binding protein 3)